MKYKYRFVFVGDKEFTFESPERLGLLYDKTILTFIIFNGDDGCRYALNTNNMLYIEEKIVDE